MSVKAIKTMTNEELEDYVNGLASEHLGKVDEINLPGLSAVQEGHLAIPYILQASMPRLQKLHAITGFDAGNALMFAMADNFDIFKHYADHELILDVVRAGFIFDTKHLVFYQVNGEKNAPGTFKDAPIELKTEFGKFPEPDETTEPVKITGFTVRSQNFGHGVDCYIIEVQTNVLKTADIIDEKKVRAVAEQLNKQLVKNLLK